MKKITFTLLLLLSCYQWLRAQCPTTDITLSSQGQINSFPMNYPGCKNILGSLTIQENTEDITNLDSLSQINSIAGNMNLFFTDQLTSLSGLESLTFIGGNLDVDENSGLTSLSGLESLTSIGGRLILSYNNAITNLSGLDNLTSIGGVLSIQDQDDLTNLSGLDNLTSIGGLSIIYCDALTNLSGLDNLTSIGGFLSFEHNHVLTSLSSLNNVTFLSGYIRVNNNDALTNLNGLGNLTSIGGYLTILNNDALTSLSGLDSVSSIGGDLTIQNNHALTNFSSLENLTSISGFLSIREMDVLTSLSGLDNINPAIITGVYIQKNPQLVTCNVESICSYLENSGNANISNNASGCDSVPEILAACQVPVKVPFDENEQVQVFPNPTNGILYIQCSGHCESTYRIRNSIGSLIRAEQLNSMDYLDISNLSNGLYLIEIGIGNPSIIKRIVKTE